MMLFFFIFVSANLWLVESSLSLTNKERTSLVVGTADPVADMSSVLWNNFLAFSNVRRTQQSCDPEDKYCQFELIIEADLGDQQNLLNRKSNRDLFEFVTKNWINKQRYCEGDDEFYDSIRLDITNNIFDRNLLRRVKSRRGTGKGRCRGRNCPREIVYSFPFGRRRTESGQAVDECDITLLQTLKEVETTDSGGIRRKPFSSVENLNLALSGGVLDEIQNCSTSDCADQRRAIEALYNEIDVPYDETMFECAWDYLTCNEDNEIYIIDLYYKKHSTPDVVGTLPTELGLLDNVELLLLGNLNINGPIPTQVGEMLVLHDLSLEFNYLTAKIPSQLGLLGELRTLNLSCNFLTGTIPSELGYLINLENLQLDLNGLTGTIPSEIGLLKNLRFLTLGNNYLSGEVPVEVCNLPNLNEYQKKDLGCKFNNFDDDSDTDSPETVTVNGFSCSIDDVVLVNNGCESGFPHFDIEGSVCANDGLFEESYCSYSVGEHACVYCSNGEKNDDLDNIGNDQYYYDETNAGYDYDDGQTNNEFNDAGGNDDNAGNDYDDGQTNNEFNDSGGNDDNAGYDYDDGQTNNEFNDAGGNDDNDGDAGGNDDYSDGDTGSYDGNSDDDYADNDDGYAGNNFGDSDNYNDNAGYDE